jgi:hypothetical protein
MMIFPNTLIDCCDPRALRARIVGDYGPGCSATHQAAW